MGKTSEKWHSVSIPKNVLHRIRGVLRFTTDQSLAEYVRQAIERRLRSDEVHAEEQRMLEAEIKERLKD